MIDSSTVRKQAAMDIRAGMPLEQFDEFYPDLRDEKQLFSSYASDVKGGMPETEDTNFYPEIFRQAEEKEAEIEEPFKPKSEVLTERAREQISAAPELFEEGREPTPRERVTAAGEVVKGGISAFGAGASALAEKVIEGFGIGGTFLGTKIEQLKGTVSADEADQVFSEIITSEDFFNQPEQQKADILNLASSLALPALGASRLASLTSKAQQLAAGAGVGLGATALGTAQLEGRLPTPVEAGIGAVTGGALGRLEGALASRAARRAEKIGEKEEQLRKFTTEILQPPKAARPDIGVGLSPEGVTEASKVIQKAENFKSIDQQLDNVATDAIEKVNRAIQENADKSISFEYLRPLQDEVARLRVDPTKQKIADSFERLLEQEMQFARTAGIVDEGVPIVTAQARKRQFNEDLSKFFNKKDPTDLEAAEVQARNLIRKGLMEGIEKELGKEIGDLNRTFGNLSDARAWLKNVSDRFDVEVTPTTFQRVLNRIPIVKSILSGRPDTVIGTRSGALVDILSTRTGEIEKLRKDISKLKKKSGVIEEIPTE